MVEIRIKDLPAGTPTGSKKLAMDLSSAESATITDIVIAGRPSASQAEAEAGVNSIKAMTPLTTSQAITAVAVRKDNNLSDLASIGSAQDNLQTEGSYQSVALAAASTIPSRNQRIYVRFNNPSFGTASTLAGAAHYRQANNDAEYSALPSLAKFTSANGIKFVIDERVLTPYMFGARADADGIWTAGVVGGTDSLAAFNAMQATALYFKSSIFIQGYFRLSGAFFLDYAAQVGETDFRVPVSFGGARSTILYFDNGNFHGLRIRGGLTNDTNPSFLSIGGVQLRKNDRQGFGLYLEGHFHMSVRDIHVLGFQYGILGADIHECNFDNVVTRFNDYGCKLQRVSFTQPNIMTFVNCTFGNSANLGVNLVNPSTFQMIGGSIEGNGVTGADAAKGGMIATYDVPTLEGTVGINLFGVYLETNMGDADILIQNSSGNNIVNNITGCSFQRNGAAIFVTNCITYAFSGPNRNVLNLIGNGFSSFNDYVPNAARKYVNVVGTVGPLIEVNEIGNLYEDAVETPDLAIFRSGYARVYRGASQGEILDTGSISSGHNLASSTRLSAGLYQIDFNTPMADDTYFVNAVCVGGLHYTPSITAVLTTGFTVRFSIGGVATDTRFRFMVNGATA